MNDDTSAAFEQASQLLARTAAAIGDDDWHRPGLGSWTVLELLAHADRAHTTIEDYLLHPQPSQPPNGPYFAPGAVAQRARDAVAALGADPARRVAETGRRVTALVADTAPETLIHTPAGAVTLERYLPSRTTELVVHSMDLARATDQDPDVPVAAASAALGFVAHRAAAAPDRLDVLLALTGRKDLPAGYSVF